MALAVTVDAVWHDGQRTHVLGTIVASGNYATGGDTMDLGVRDFASRAVPIWMEILGQAGFIYRYIAGATLAACKMMAFVNTAGGANAALGEHTAAAYAAGITGDTIKFHAIIPFGS